MYEKTLKACGFQGLLRCLCCGVRYNYRICHYNAKTLQHKIKEQKGNGAYAEHCEHGEKHHLHSVDIGIELLFEGRTATAVSVALAGALES